MRRAGAWFRERLSRFTDREKVAIALFMLPVAIGIVLAFLHESSEATLSVEQPISQHAMTMLAGGKGAAHLWARPVVSTLRASATTDPGPAGPASREVEVGLPVAGKACLRLRAEIGGVCQGGQGAATRAARPLTVEWPTTGDLKMSASGLTTFTAGETEVTSSTIDPATWTFQINAPKTAIDFECLEPASFQVVFQGKPRAERCVRGPHRLTLTLVLSGAQVATLSLASLASFGATARGREAQLSVRRGELSAGGHESEVRGADVPVAIAADGDNGSLLELENRGDGRGTDITVSAASADSVEVHGEEKLPSLLDAVEEWWFLFIGLTGGLVLSVFIERVPSED